MSGIQIDSHIGGNVGLLLDYTGDSGPHSDTLVNVMTGNKFSYRSPVRLDSQFRVSLRLFGPYQDYK